MGETQVSGSSTGQLNEAAAIKGEQDATMNGAPALREEAAMNEEEAMNIAAGTSASSVQEDEARGSRNGRDQRGAKRKGDDRDKWGKGSKGCDKKKPKWGRGTENGEGSEAREGAEDVREGGKRLPKKRAAVLVSYCGTGYSGMQIQTHDSQTIEGDIFAALVKAGAVSPDNADDHRKVDMQRAARTDAGVHAAGNVISMKIIFEPPLPDGVTDLATHANSFLPEQIRIWGFVRTINSFQARTYEYLLPSYCLLPPASADALAKQLDKSSPGWRDKVGPGAEFADAGAAADVDEGVAEESGSSKARADPDGPEKPEEPEERIDGDLTREGRIGKNRGEFERRRAWRVDKGTMTRFSALIDQFKGTHNFHNYTIGKPFNDPTVKRYMIDLEVKDPRVYGDIEWISVQIHGQSFMLHQIRKMISAAMLACRTASPPSLLPETFGPKRIQIPKAPPVGLLLEAPQFRTFNDRVSKTKGGDERDPVDFGPYADQIHQFKVKHIYEKLREEELAAHAFHKWIRQMDCTTNDELTWLNTQGVIPPEALTTTKPKASPRPAESDVEAGKKSKGSRLASDDDAEVDAELLKRGDLEG